MSDSVADRVVGDLYESLGHCFKGHYEKDIVDAIANILAHHHLGTGQSEEDFCKTLDGMKPAYKFAKCVQEENDHQESLL